MPYIFILAVIGILGGLTSGLFGVGGGVIFVPLLILLRKVDPHLAIGTSLAAIAPTALAGAARHAQSSMIDWRTALMLAGFAIVGAWAGAQLSLQMDAALVRRLYAVFLFALSLKMFFPG